MRKLGILLILLAAMPASVLAADNKAYWGLMLGSVDYDDPLVKIYTTGASVRVGYDFVPYFGLEGRLLTTTSGSKAGVNDLKIDYMGSVFAKVNAPLTKSHRFMIYGLLGYSALKISYYQGKDFYFTDNGPSYGFGFDFFADERNGLNIEWVRFIDQQKSGTDYTVTQIGIGYIRRF